jgi:hypothetical protein
MLGTNRFDRFKFENAQAIMSEGTCTPVGSCVKMPIYGFMNHQASFTQHLHSIVEMLDKQKSESQLTSDSLLSQLVDISISDKFSSYKLYLGDDYCNAQLDKIRTTVLKEFVEEIQFLESYREIFTPKECDELRNALLFSYAPKWFPNVSDTAKPILTLKEVLDEPSDQEETMSDDDVDYEELEALRKHYTSLAQAGDFGKRYENIPAALEAMADDIMQDVEREEPTAKRLKVGA